MEQNKINNVENLNSHLSYNELSRKEKIILIDWIENNLIESKSINRNTNSYQLKHYFEHSQQGFYVTNGQFKGAMLEAGFKYEKIADDSMNWYFNISEKCRKEVKKTYIYDY